MPYRYCPYCATPLSTRRIEHIERLICDAPGCNFVFWNNPVPVVAALVEYQGQYLLARNVKWPRRIFSLITGFLDPQETPEQAVVREVKEELNLEGVITRFIGHYAFPEKNQLILAFALCATGELATNQEIAEIKHLSLEALRAYDFMPLYITSNILNSYLNQVID